MNILADENLDFPIVKWLREQGHDVKYVVELQTGMPDPSVLAIAAGEQRVLITNDLDHGELVFRQGRAAHGVLLLRQLGITWQERLSRFQSIWAAISKGLPGHFVVVKRDRARRRPLL